MYRPVLITPPAATPVTLDEAKQHLREDSNDQDGVIQGLIAAAVSYLDGWTGILGRCLMPQTWRLDFDRFDRCMRLPLLPIASIVSVKYEDEAGAAQTINSAFYSLECDDLGAFVRFKSTYGFVSLCIERPAVHIEVIAGYSDADAVPASIKIGMLMLVAHWYANREATVVDSRAAAIEVPFAVSALLAPFRRV